MANTVTTRTTAVGVFHDRRAAQDAISDLKRAGFTDEEIGYTARHMDASAGSVSAADGRDASGVTTDTGPGSGALSGAATGGILGGILGAAASLAIPGVGPVIAAGFLGPILGGAAAGAALGAAGGGIVGGLVTTGVPEEEARFYDGEFRSGRHIVTVRANGRYQEAHDILSRHRASFYGAGAMGASGMASTTT